MKTSPIPRKTKTHIHLMQRTGWLRAAVLGANDGILSTASILAGMAAGGASAETVVLAGLAGLVAGATSMATGEYVSVSSQADIERSDLAREKKELAQNDKYEHEELAQIYVARGLDLPLARLVADRLMAHDALAAHARDELGISTQTRPRPLQAALASAASFAAGALLPLIIVLLAPLAFIPWSVSIGALLSLILLGMLGAKLSGVALLRPTLRVLFWGVISLGLTMLVGAVFGIRPA